MATLTSTDLRKRRLGSHGLEVTELGLGCMGMSEFYTPDQMQDADSIRVIHHYLDRGGNFLDTADMYGVGRNEELVGRAIAGRRSAVVLATKFGNVRGQTASSSACAAIRRTSANATVWLCSRL